jgi:alpha-L-rhamnosidase
LTVDGQAHAVGVITPSFAWHLADHAGAAQTAYRIVVRGDGGHREWDSGRVRSPLVAARPYGGPTLGSDRAYTWTVQTWDERGRVSAPSDAATFATGLQDSDWRAQWVRGPFESSDPETYTLARRELAVSASPIVRANVFVAAGQQMRLSVNGRPAGFGPEFAYPDAQFYVTVDVTRLLHAGHSNAIGVLSHWSGPGKGRPASAPGFILQMTVDHADGTRQMLVTDAQWRARRGPWLPGQLRNLDSGDRVESIDGRDWPVGWDQPGYDDRAWTPVTVIGPHPTPPFTHLVSQRTSIAEHVVHPVTVTPRPDGGVVADFGSVLAAVPSVTFASGTSGRSVHLVGGYVLDPDGRVSTTRSTQQTDMSWTYIERNGRQTFQPFVYLGFRYLEIDGAGEDLSARDVAVVARHAAMPDEEAATFSSSDRTVDAVWELARHSALYGSQEHFVDTPTREKGAFLRDSFNISEAAMDAFGDQELTRQALLEFADSQRRFWPDGRLNADYPNGEGKRDIPDFTEIYPEWVWRYYMRTGDRTTLAQLYPVMRNIAAYVTSAIDQRTGLVTNLPGGDGDYVHGIVDWPPAMRYGYDVGTVARTTVNLLAVDVYRRVADAAAALGHTNDKTADLRLAHSVAASVNRRLRRGDGIYADGLEANGEMSAHASQHANAIALDIGIVPREREAAVAAYTASLGTAMGPMTVESLLRGLDAGGRDGDLVTALTDAARPGWANILARGGTFTWEAWDPSDAEGDSMSHGWGDTALVAIQELLLGVRPTAPGMSAVEIRPPSAGLASARGRVPTPYGPIDVDWRRTAGRVALHVRVPAGVTATIVLPGEARTTVGAGTHDLKSP